MKKLGMLINGKPSLYKCLPLALAAMALVVTGCPHNQYIVQLKPQGNHIERTLIFYREDGVNTNTGTPNYQPDAAELAAITTLYQAQGLTNDGGRYIARGEFTNELPTDVGGAGAYTNLTTSLGEAGFYVERFRGNDDLAGMTEQRFKAADRLADLFIGWSRMELGRERGYDKLRQFLDVDFRRDLKNLSAYWWEGQLASGYKTNADEEFIVRFGQYLFERGYFKIGEIPGLLRNVTGGDDSQALLRPIQRLVARKMGVPEAEPVPASLAFLADETTMNKSFDKYLAGTAQYRAKLKQWKTEKKLKPDLKQPKPSEVMDNAGAGLIEFGLFGQPDHLAVRLSLPAAPVYSNGRWDEAVKQVVWETDIEDRTNASHFPFSCYASWAQADQAYQTEHFGKVVLAGDELTQYCLWRSGQDKQRGDEWDAFLAGLQPGSELVKKLDAFRFPGESDQAGTNSQPKIPSPSVYPRELLKAALR